jgi:hypothetical protein
MSKQEMVAINPEGLEIANSYLQEGSIEGVCRALKVSRDVATAWLNKREVRKYIDTVYLDSGYRNRNKLGDLLDEIIESKLQEARADEFYSKKDLADLITLAMKLRESAVKEARDSDATSIKNQTNVQINEGGIVQGKYGELLTKLFNKEQEECLLSQSGE